MEILTGAAGCGKTYRIYNRIKEDLKNGKQVLLIVPDREVLEAETTLISMFDGVPCDNLDVYSFSRICNDFFRRYGSLCYNYIDKTSIRLLVFIALCNVGASLKEYKNIKTTDFDAIESIAQTISSLKRAGAKPATLEKILDEMDGDDEVSEKTRDRIFDIMTVYASYEVLLKQGYDDPDDDMTKMLSMLPSHRYFEDKCVYIDSFGGFTSVQLGVIEQICTQSLSLCVSLLISPCPDKSCEDGVFAPAYKTFKDLKKIAAKTGNEFTFNAVTGGRRYGNEQLKLLEQCFYDNLICNDEPKNVTLAECATVYDECERVCYDIAKRVREGGRYRDYLVIFSDRELYSGVLRSCFEKHKISYYMSQRSEIMRKPFIKFVLYALEICANNFYSQSVISYIKTGILPLNEESAFRFENYVNTWRISGKRFYAGDWLMNPHGYAKSVGDEEKILEELNDLREYLITPLYDLMTEINGGERTCAAYREAMYSFLKSVEVNECLRRARDNARMLGDTEEEAQLGQLWRAFFAALDTLVTLCGDLQIGTKEYSELLTLVLSKTDIGTIPSSADAVDVGGYDSIVGKHPKGIYIIGLNEGKLPSAPSKNGLLSEKDTEVLCRYGVDFGMSEWEKQQKQLYDFYRASACPTDFVRYSYFSSTTVGESCRPSTFLDRIISSFPMLNRTKKIAPKLIDTVYCEEKGLEVCAKNKNTPEGGALYEIFSESEKYKGVIASLSQPISNEKQSLNEQSLKNMYKGDLMLSQTKIKAFNDCKFAYYCKYGLKLRETEQGEIKANDIGTLIHFVLQRVVEDEMNGLLPNELTDDDMKQLCDKYTDEYLKMLFMYDNEVNGKTESLIKRLKKNLVPTLKYVTGELRNSDFKPVGVEMKMGRGGIEPVRIKLSDGTEAILSGIADRVDIYEKNGIKYVKLTDYKTGENTFKYEDLEKCEGIQLFLYMISICGQGDEYKPAAAFYMSGRVSETEVSGNTKKIPADAEETIIKRGVALDDPEIIQALAHGNTKYFKLPSATEKKITMLDGEKFANTFESLKATVRSLAEEMKKGNADAEPKISGTKSACDYCTYKFFCRKSR